MGGGRTDLRKSNGVRASYPTSSEEIAIPENWRRWITRVVGAGASWTRQLDDDQEWFLRPGDIPTFVAGLAAAMTLRRAEVLRELESGERLPRDPDARQRVLDTVLAARLAKDPLYTTTSALHRLLVDAEREGQIVMFDPFV